MLIRTKYSSIHVRKIRFLVIQQCFAVVTRIRWTFSKTNFVQLLWERVLTNINWFFSQLGFFEICKLSSSSAISKLKFKVSSFTHMDRNTKTWSQHVLSRENGIFKLFFAKRKKPNYSNRLEFWSNLFMICHFLLNSVLKTIDG